jgi:mono/diheme cytochrome c family protein
VGPVLAGLLVLSGCSNEYDHNLKYPPRTDPLVSASLAAVPTQIDKPGDFPDILVNLSAADQKSVLNPENLKPDARQQVGAILDDNFGTPAQPKVAGLEDTQRDELKLDQATLAQGSSLYRLHCLHCHGLTGNGRGPTAPWVNPHPRDYREGIFKFTSTDAAKLGNARKPRRADLHRTVRQGIEGTTMPAFSLLTDAEIEALVSYVIHLSLRGEVEFNLMKKLIKEDITTAADIKESFDEDFGAITKNWLTSAQPASAIKPDPTIAANVKFPPTEKQKQSVIHGWELFRSTAEAGCIGCHQDYGRQGNLFYDAWGTIGRPADLTLGSYRGGRRPIDLYYRIHSGVNGSNMPAFGKLLVKDMNDQDIWDLISFLEVLPYPKMRQQFGIDIDKAEPPPVKVAER